MQTVYLTDITGTIGEWLDSEFDSEVPFEVAALLQRAYEVAAKELEKHEQDLEKLVKIEKTEDIDDGWFGEVRWCDEDLKCALEECGKLASEENIQKLYSQCSKHWFTDRMIEAGWEYIYDAVADLS